MQIIVFTKETGNLVMHSGPYIINTNKIIELEGITSINDDKGYYVAWTDNSIKLKVPIKKTNVIYK